MSRKNRLARFGEQEGFGVTSGANLVRAERVPCLFAGGIVGTCTIDTSYDSTSNKPTSQIGGDDHAVRITLDGEYDGLVYNADGTPIGNLIGGDGKTWSNISIRKGSSRSPEKDEAASDLIHRYAKQIVGAVAAAAYTDTASLTRKSPFKIPNTFEARAALAPVQDRIRDQRIAIIGLGGTGAYVLDLVAKTPVKEIHLLDPDEVDWHNFMRAPGAPTEEEIESKRKESLCKVNYYHSKYEALREGIHLHAVRVDDLDTYREFLLDLAIDYAFVCIDQLTEGDSPRQDVVYRALNEAEVPFIDSGVSLSVEKSVVGGSVTTGAYDVGSKAWKVAIPNAKVEGNLPGYRNVQLPEVNALAAALAVMEWRRRTGQFTSESASYLHKFRLEKPCIVTLD